ncbi:solute carrier family 22 member 3-like [Episyrphus balteatus]|uniref:solute carrier family 22 member 3-like n=1 Tax=Episyrphus balteatus TaxID=286459 RepID=UPI002486071E|nr:solute carrier family 22 member 3-like [Episyrphus balteatus]
MSSKENGCAEKDSSESHPFVLDDIFLKIGQFGTFRVLQFFLAFTVGIFHTNMKYSYLFTAGPVVYRCQVPECDGLESSSYQQPWTEFSIPKAIDGNLKKCQRYKPFNTTRSDGQYFCNSENYDNDLEIDCDNGLIFRDEKVTISHDFNIFCSDEWKLAMIGSITNLAQFLGLFWGGYFSDRYGRVAVLTYGGVSSAIMGILRSFSPNYYIFAMLGFLDNFLGGAIFGTTFVLILESLGPKIRVHASNCLPFSSGIAKVVTAIAAKNINNWRLLEQVFYIPALGFIALPWLLPESFRLLLSLGKEEKAIKVLRKAAKNNKRKLSESSIEKLLEFNRQNLADVNETKNNNNSPVWDAFKIFPRRILTCNFLWFTHVFLFFGLTINSASLGGNKYYSFMFAGLVEIPGTLLPSLTINRFGRRYSLSGFLLLTGISIALMAFVNPSSHDLMIILNLCGKLSISASFQCLNILTTELFPTTTRNSLVSFCSTIGRIGSIVAPQAPLLAKYYVSGPSILFASSAFIAGFLVFSLPETKGSVLPATLHEAEMIGKKEVNVEPETKDKLLSSKV